MFKIPKTLLAAAMAVFALSAASCSSTPQDESTGEYVDSTVVSTKVRAKIADDPAVSIFDIDVATFKNTVQLSGFVNTEAEKTRAGQIASRVEGVKEVINNIVVKKQ